MRFYVASRFRNYRAVREVVDKLKAMGHSISCDWTRTSEFDPVTGELIVDPEKDLSRVEKVTYAYEDMFGVKYCDALILLWHEDMGGAYMEAGMALAWQKEVFVVDPDRFTIFWSMPGVRIFNSIEEVYKYIGNA